MSDTELENSLGVLKILSEALTVPRSLDEGLEHITRITCELMETGQAVFLFRDEEQQELLVKAAVGLPGMRNGTYLTVPERLKTILWRLRNIHHINWVYSGIDDIAFPIIVAPIWVKGVRVGLLATGGAKDPSPRPFDVIRQKMFALLAPFASLVIENAKAYDLLKQHFAINSQELRDASSEEAAESGRAPTEQLMVNSISNPTKVVKILAESFYKELRRSGFETAHIASAAAQLLECAVKEG